MAQVIRIKRRLTGGAAGAPGAGTLVAGEMAYNEVGNSLWIGGTGTPAAIHQINVAAPIYIGVTFPNPPVSGDLWFNTTLNRLQVYNGTTWVDAVPPLEGPLIVVGNYNVTLHQVHGVRPPASPGLAENAALPLAAPENRGWIFVVDNGPGTGALPAPVVPMVNGDYVVSNGTAWVHVAAGGPWLPVNNPTFTGVMNTLTGNYQVGGQPIGKQYYSTAWPAALGTAAAGDIWYESTGEFVNFHTGTAWTTVLDGGTF
jgi:hypothetical protein